MHASFYTEGNEEGLPVGWPKQTSSEAFPGSAEVTQSYLEDLMESLSASMQVVRDSAALFEWTSGDYKQFRKALASHVVSVGFANLSTRQKEKAARHFVVDAASRSSVLSLAEQIDAGKMFHKLSMECRTNREQAAISEVYNRASKATAFQIARETLELFICYTQFGIEGSLEGDGEGIYDYILSRSSYAGAGMVELTSQATADIVHLKLRDGE